MTNTTTIKGHLAADPDLRYTQNDRPVINFRLAHTPRRYSQQTGQWEDAGETVWLPVTLWGPDAETWAQQAQKGTLATVTGRLAANRYTTRDGDERYEIGITADACTAHTRNPNAGDAHGHTHAPAGAQNSTQPGATGGYGSLADNQDDEPPF